MSNEQLLASIETMLDRKLDEKLDKRFEAFEQRMDEKMDKRFEDMEKKFDQKLNDMEDRIVSAQERMNVSISEVMETMIEKSENRMKAHMDGIKEELSGRLDRIEFYTVNIDRRVKKLERSVYRNGGFVSDNVVGFVKNTDEEEDDE